MENWLERTEKVYGGTAVKRLASLRIILFGLGGVGGHAAEALARSGIGAIDLVDYDTVEITNLNRQLAATTDTIGKQKTEVLAERIRKINPECRVTCRNLFFLPETSELFDFTRYDFVLDAIDTVSAKVCLIEQAVANGVPVISSMGTGNRRDPSALTVTDLAKTHDDPLAKVVRRKLKDAGIAHLPVVFSEEKPFCAEAEKGDFVGSTAFVPAAAGILMASYAVNRLTEMDSIQK